MKSRLKIVISLILIFISVFGGIIAYLINPFDAQYKAYQAETEAAKAFEKGDMVTYVNYMSNPVTIKYHAPLALYFVLINMGRYDEAKQAVDSFIKYKDYGICADFKNNIIDRITCRIIAFAMPVEQPWVDKNFWYSLIYLEKGEYEKALKYYKQSQTRIPCYSARIYAALNDRENSSKYIKMCEALYAPKESKKALYETKGYMYLRQKKYDVAQDYLLKALKEKSEKFGQYTGYENIYLLLAQLYKEQNNPAKARYYYEQVIKTDPYNYKAQKGLGLVLHH